MKRLNMKYLDNNHYIISGKAAHFIAHKYANRNVPKVGYKIKLQIGFYVFWLKRTVDQGKVVWTLHNVNQYDMPYMGNINLHCELFKQVKEKGYILL